MSAIVGGEVALRIVGNVGGRVVVRAWRSVIVSTARKQMAGAIEPLFQLRSSKNSTPTTSQTALPGWMSLRSVSAFSMSECTSVTLLLGRHNARSVADHVVVAKISMECARDQAELGAQGIVSV